MTSKSITHGFLIIKHSFFIVTKEFPMLKMATDFLTSCKFNCCGKLSATKFNGEQESKKALPNLEDLKLSRTKTMAVARSTLEEDSLLYTWTKADGLLATASDFNGVIDVLKPVRIEWSNENK